MPTKFMCWECGIELNTIENGALVCKKCRQQFRITIQTVREEDGVPKDFIYTRKEVTMLAVLCPACGCELVRGKFTFSCVHCGREFYVILIVTPTKEEDNEV